MTELFTFPAPPHASSFWRFQQTFLQGNLDLSSIKLILMGVGIASAFLLIVMLILHFRPKKPYIPQDCLLDPDQIRNMLSIALSQRSKFELQLVPERTVRRPALRCAAYELDQNGITLEADGLAALSPRWIGKQADCFFIIRRRESFLFYTFVCTILDITTRNGVCYIRMAIPDRIEPRQKRSYLRIIPPEEYMLGAAIWRGLDMPNESEWNDLPLWQPPSRILLPATREDFTIRDVSSGGMRLHLPRHALMDETELIHVSARFIVMLDLWDPDKGQRMRFWLLCRMQSPVLDFETKGMDLGAQFLAWAKPAPQGDGKLLWLKLSTSGEVEPLGNWIMRRHLEYFRESEQNAVLTAREVDQMEMGRASA